MQSTVYILIKCSNSTVGENIMQGVQNGENEFTGDKGGGQGEIRVEKCSP